MSLLWLLRLALLSLRRWWRLNIRRALPIVELFRCGGGNRRVRASTPAAASASPAPASSTSDAPAPPRFIRFAG